MVPVLVVGSAVQKKRGHQRGVTREGQQQSKKSCLCVSILFSQATKWKVEQYEIYILPEFIRCMTTLADRGVDLET